MQSSRDIYPADCHSLKDFMISGLFTEPDGTGHDVTCSQYDGRIHSEAARRCDLFIWRAAVAGLTTLVTGTL